MALRVLNRKLRCPATVALQRPSCPVVPPTLGSRFFTSESSQNGARRAVNGTRNVRSISKELRKAEKRMLRDMEEDKRKFEELSIAINNLPKNIVLTCTVGIVVLTSSWAYLCGVFDGNRASYGGRKHSA